MTKHRPLLALLFLAAFAAALLTQVSRATPQENPDAKKGGLTRIQKPVKLLSAGQGPKKPLRFQVEKGFKQTAVMTVAMAMESKFGTLQQPKRKFPSQVVTMEFVVTDTSPEGDIHYDSTIKKIELDETDVEPFIVQMVKSQLKGIEGLTGKIVVTDRGITKQAAFNAPSAASAQQRQMLESMKQSMSQFSAPFPEEAVGVGAKWEHEVELHQNSMKVKQVATYELVELEGSGGKIKFKTKLHADPQEVKPEGSPITMKLESFSGVGNGETAFDLGKVIRGADLSVKTAAKMGLQGQTMDMKVEMTAKIEPQKKK